MNKLIFFLSLMSATTMLGCGNSHHDDGGNDAPIEVGNWSADDVTIQCPSGDCPEGVGAIIFVQHLTSSIKLSRCTATLIDRDKVLTNSHCNKELTADESYFFVNIGGQTQRFPVFQSDYDTGVPNGPEAGMRPDLAIYTLTTDVFGITPRTVSRTIPNQMTNLVAYVINEPGASRFTNFELQKEFCSTQNHQNRFSGGVLDQAIGLALYGCQVIPGNSGSPVFSDGDFTDIQVVINTSYHIGPTIASSGGPADPTVFGMGNRVQCMDLPDESSPATTCVQAHFASALLTAGSSFTTGIKGTF